jgi:hypothetical protein
MALARDNEVDADNRTVLKPRITTEIRMVERKPLDRKKST